MYTIAILFFVCFMFGMPAAFSDYFECVERYEFVQHFQVPQDMVFWTECEDTEFYPEVVDGVSYQKGNLHMALIRFWNELPSCDITVAQERVLFPGHVLDAPVLSYSHHKDNQHFSWLTSYFA